MNNKVVIYGNTRLKYSWFYKTYREGLKLNGYEVHDIDYRSCAPAAAYSLISEIKPVVMFTHISFHKVYPIPQVLNMYADVRKKIGTKVIHVLMDARHEPRYPGDLSQAFDCALLSNTQHQQNFSNYWKIPVHFQPYASLTYSNMVKPARDLQFKEAVFTGNPNSHTDRTNFIKLLNKSMPLRVFMTQSKNDLRHRTPELSTSAWAILGLCTGYDIEHYVDVRPFQYMGCGAVMIMRKFHMMDNIIPPDLYYPFDSYDETGAASVKNDYNINCYKQPNTEMRERAFKFIQQKHSSRVRLKDIMDVILGKRKFIRSFRWQYAGGK